MEKRPWKPKMLPPMWVAAGVLAIIALERWLPGVELAVGGWRWLGLIPALAGTALAIWGERQFASAGTGVIPGSEITAFVRTGPYRFTRNPMYVGMTLVLLGAAWFAGAMTAWVVPPLFALVIQHQFIRREEAMLRATFGDVAWDEYAATTRRWV